MIRKVFLVAGLCLLVSSKIWSQANVNSENRADQDAFLKQELPMDKSIKKGVLPNGLTYYLHSTDVVKDAASYYIIQNVGSILENDDQQGLAHFLEHMAFNGTASFPEKSFLNKMEENGLMFGRDINAYTSFDETVYNINNVPVTPEMTEAGLTILHDWANALLLTDKEIDAERGVIKEEWRTGQDGRARIMEQTIDAYYGGSKYAKRLPIGLMSIVEDFKYKTLRDFYHDWYRTDLQAIAIVGDIDIAEMESKIKARFSAIPAVKNPLERYNVKIEDNEQLAYAIGMDKEVSTAEILFSIRHDKSLEDQTVTDLKDVLLNRMVTQALNERLQELSLDPDAPFFGVQVYYQPIARLHESFELNIYPKESQQEAAFALAMQELQRAVKFGFTGSEVNRSIEVVKSLYENQIAEIDDRPHGQIIQIIQNNYLENAHITDIVGEYEIAKKLLASFGPVDFLEQLRSMYSERNRSVIVTGVEGKENLTEVQAKEIIHQSENDPSLQAYTDENLDRTLMDGVELQAGTIVNTAKNDDIGYTTYTLGNGVEVHYKFVDKEKNDVLLEAISDGGASLVKNEDRPSLSVVDDLVQLSGIGDFSAPELQKVMSGKRAEVYIDIQDIHEVVNGRSSTKDVETMLQLVNLSFAKPRFEQDGFQVLKQSMENFLLYKQQDLRAKMQDSLIVNLYGKNHPVERLISDQYIKDVNFDKVRAIYKDRFANAADFKFFIVGDIRPEELEPLLEKYIAGITTTEKKEKWRDNESKWQSKDIDKDVYLSMEDALGSVNIGIKKEIPYSLKSNYLVSILGEILKLRYTESLREQEGGTYGARVNAFLRKEPKSTAILSVSFDCNPDMVEKLIEIVHAEIDDIKQGKISQADLDKIISNFLKDRGDQKNYNGYDLTTIKNYVLEGYNMNDPKNFEQIINSITKEDVQSIASMILEDSESYEIVFKPKIK